MGLIHQGRVFFRAVTIFLCYAPDRDSQQMLSIRKRGSPTIVSKDGNPDLGQSGGKMDEEKKEYSLGHGR